MILPWIQMFFTLTNPLTDLTNGSEVKVWVPYESMPSDKTRKHYSNFDEINSFQVHIIAIVCFLE